MTDKGYSSEPSGPDNAPTHSQPPGRSKRLRRWIAVLFGLALLPPLACLLYGVAGDRPAPADVGLVFGTTVHPDGTPSDRLEARLRRGLELYRNGVVQRLAVTGGLGREGVEEADAMRDWLAARGVPPGDILVDRGGLDTWRSLRFARERQRTGDWGAVVSISSPTHLLRLRLACWRLGVETSGAASSRYWNATEVGRAFREAAALVYYTLRRDTETARETPGP